MAIHRYQADLHIHTLLSPCGEIEMLPSLIIEAAIMAGLDIIGISDHNSAENADAVMKASAGSGIRVLPGLEVQSLEGVHLLCLFDTVDQAVVLQEAVYASLPFGSDKKPKTEEELIAKELAMQMIVDECDEFVGYCQRYLSLPTMMDISEVWQRVQDLNGILIPAHIDRKSTGLCDVLGMVPDSPDFVALEISRNITPDKARKTYPSIGDRSLICNSDSHWLAAVGERRTVFCLEHRTIAEMKMACRGEDGRGIEYA